MTSLLKRFDYPFSEKQVIFYQESNAKINIAAGSVRSGKSYILLHRFIDEIYKGPPGKMLFTGKSEKTIRDNIIDPMNTILGGKLRYFSGHGYCMLGDRKINVVGANDERSVGKIQGNTYAGALGDELATLPQSFFDMLMTRLSITDSKFFGGTNPDSPYHWLKTEYIDKLKDHPQMLKTFNFVLEDNPILDESYIQFLKTKFSGLWYKRYIEGQWVLADGSVYDFFDQKKHVRRGPPTYAKYYLLGIDYGTNNPFAAVLIGFNDDYTPTLWVEKEYYWDPKVEGFQKTNAEFARDLEDTFGGYPIKLFYIDPSAQSFEVELRRNRKPVKHANNDVLEGIRSVSTLLSQGDLVICEDCPNLIKEFESYIWDEKAVRRGEDKPVKQRDHLLDALRYGLFTHFGKKTSLKEPTIEEMRLKNWNKNPMANQGFGPESYGWSTFRGQF